MNHIPTIMPTKARVVSDRKMDVMKRLLVGDVPTNLAGMSIYAFGFPVFLAFGPPQGDGAVLLTSLMMAGLWTGLMRGGPILPKLIVPDLAGNKRVFRMLPVRGDDWADAVWAQRVVIPFGILAVLSVPCLLIAALLGKLDTALWCRTLSNLALACVFLCAGRQLLAATMQKRRSKLVAAFVWLFGVFAILADLSIMGYVSLSLFLSPVGASAAVALGLLTFGHSFLTRREMCADPVLETALAGAERPCEISAGSPLKRFFNGCQPFLGFASMMLFLNLFVSVLAFLVFLSPTLATMGIGEHVKYVAGGLLAIAVLLTVPNPAVSLRVLGTLPLGRRRLAMILSLSALVQACANLASSALVMLCGLALLGRGRDLVNPELLYFIPACLGFAVVWYSFNLRTAEGVERLMLSFLVAGLFVPLATLTAGVWALYAGLVFLPLGVHLGFRIALRALHQSDVYKQPAWEMFPRELPRSW